MKSNISWNWHFASFGAVMAMIALAVILSGEVLNGVFMLIGSIPAAIVGLAPRRRDRKAVLIVGVLFSVSILLGSALATWTPLAIVGMFAVAYLSVQLAAGKPAGILLLSVFLPLTAMGLTYTGIGESAKVSGLFLLGTLGSFAWAMFLPEYKGRVKPKEVLPKSIAKSYGLTIGIAAAVSTAVGFALGVEFVGWVVGSTLLVMRPNMDLLKLRGIGRMASVFVGALGAALLLLTDPAYGTVALILWLVLVMMAATSESYWYVTPAFTSFLILWALLYGKATVYNVTIRFNERVVDTVIGVSIAYILALAVPAVMALIKPKQVR